MRSGATTDQTITALQGVAGWSHSFGYKISSAPPCSGSRTPPGNCRSAPISAASSTRQPADAQGPVRRGRRRHQPFHRVLAVSLSAMASRTQAGQLHRNAVLDTRFDYWWGQQEFFQQTDKARTRSGADGPRGCELAAERSRSRRRPESIAPSWTSRACPRKAGSRLASASASRRSRGGGWAAYIESAEPFLSEFLSRSRPSA